MEKNINIQQVLLFSCLKNTGLKNKKVININYSVILIIIALTIKRILCQFNFHWKIMCTDTSND